MSDKVKIIDIDKIIITQRYREDFGNLEVLADSIREKGVLQPITVNQDLVLLAGERRVRAAKLAGLLKIPALLREQSALDDAHIDSREVELIENTFRKDFSWVEHCKLVSEIHKICQEKNIDWSARKTAKLLGHSHPMNVSRALTLAEAIQDIPELAECKTQDDAIKVLKKVEEQMVTNELRRRQEATVTTQEENNTLDNVRRMIKIAKVNYHIDDALKAMKDLPAGAGMINLIEVDPPYGIDLDTFSNKGDKASSYKEVPREEYSKFLETVATETYRIAGKDCWMIFWFGPTHHNLVVTTLRNAGWLVDDIPAIWSKGIGQTLQPELYLARSYEPFFVCRKGNPFMNKRGTNNVFNVSTVPANKKIHPTERPVQLLEDIIMTFVGPNSTLMIPFLGSGNTLRACYNLGCKGWGYDLNSEYKDKFLLAVQEDVEKLDNKEIEK